MRLKPLGIMLLCLTLLVVWWGSGSEVEAHYKTFGRLATASNHQYFYYTPSSGGSAIPTSWRPYIGLAVSDWNAASSKVKLSVTTSAVDSRFYVSDYVSGIADCLIFGNSTNPFDYWWIRFSSHENFYTNGTKYDVKTVALHELGHALGLDHVGFSLLPDTRAHIMYYTYTNAKPLHPHDIEGVVSIYGQ